MGRSDEGSHERFQEALGRSIKVMRAERGMTQQELADEAGISRSYLNQLENGARSSSRGGVSTDVLGRLAQALGESSSSFLAAVQAREEAGAYGSPARFSARRSRGRERALRKLPASGSDLVRDEPMLAPPAEQFSLALPDVDTAAGYARIQALREFEMLLPHVSAEDLEIVLGMMRRLAGQR